MDTPIADFLRHYRDDRMVRFHMPGHKGKAFLGCEALDLTEVKGADALYEADGIIAESERNAAALFGSRRTCYSTEGSSQCIRAMLYLALTHRTTEGRPVVVAARNVHKAFVYAAAMLDFDVVWLWPEQQKSLCGCPVSAEQLEAVLAGLKHAPAAVYLTSPDYLGGMADIPAMAEIAHRYGTILMVDNAHGAYLRFLKPSLHPLDLGADLCCDSAHKTLPVLTGGAYLHISKRLPEEYADHAKTAMALFGSSSPSYLTMASLDLCNRYLEEGGFRMETRVKEVRDVKNRLERANWQVEESDPLRITICAPEGETGQSLAERLRKERIECEYADDTHLVLMVTPEMRRKIWWQLFLHWVKIRQGCGFCLRFRLHGENRWFPSVRRCLPLMSWFQQSRPWDGSAVHRPYPVLLQFPLRCLANGSRRKCWNCSDITVSMKSMF